MTMPKNSSDAQASITCSDMQASSDADAEVGNSELGMSISFENMPSGYNTEQIAVQELPSLAMLDVISDEVMNTKGMMSREEALA